MFANFYVEILSKFIRVCYDMFSSVQYIACTICQPQISAIICICNHLWTKTPANICIYDIVCGCFVAFCSQAENRIFKGLWPLEESRCTGITSLTSEIARYIRDICCMYPPSTSICNCNHLYLQPSVDQNICKHLHPQPSANRNICTISIALYMSVSNSKIY